MRLGVLSLAVLLTGCWITVHPDVYCIGPVSGPTLEEKLRDLQDSCAPMLRVTLPSCVEDCHVPSY